jgi:hypothetical protein
MFSFQKMVANALKKTKMHDERSSAFTPRFCRCPLMIAQLIPWTSKDHGMFPYQASGEWFNTNTNFIPFLGPHIVYQVYSN